MSEPITFSWLPSMVREIKKRAQAETGFTCNVTVSVIKDGAIRSYPVCKKTLWIQKAISDYTGRDWTDIVASNRKDENVVPRYVYCYAHRKLFETGRVLKAIGADLQFHHGTVLHAVDTCQDALDIKDEAYTNLITYLKQNVPA